MTKLSINDVLKEIADNNLRTAKLIKTYLEQDNKLLAPKVKKGYWVDNAKAKEPKKAIVKKEEVYWGD